MDPTRLPEPPADADLPWAWAGRVPSLDGLRGVSILAVLVCHEVAMFGDSFPGWAHPLIQLGSLGVDVFFVISGFLITLLLLRERRRTGRISLRAFYSRRALRIVPAYATYVALVGTALHFTSARLTRTGWLAAATYTLSLVPPQSWYVGHAWSLSVEEHFYLVWPLLVVWLPEAALLPGCLAYAAATVGLRFALYHFHFSVLPVSNFTPVRAAALSLGCALALAVASPARRFLLVRPAVAAALASAGLAGLALSEVLILAMPDHPWARRAVDYGYALGTNLCIVAIVWAAVYRPGSILGRALNWRPLTAVGVLSYSIYLWHAAFFGPVRPAWPFRFPGNLLATAVLATASYYLVERPFLRLRTRFEPTDEARRRSEAETHQTPASVT